MILIYNFSGFLLGLVGLVAAVVMFLITEHLSFALLALAATWLTFGWRKKDRQTGQKKPFPSVFFIPLVFLAIPLALLAVPLFVIERVAKARTPDPRAALLQADEDKLRHSAASGDAILSRAILDHLSSIASEEAKAEDYHVFTRVKDDAVLVLVRAPNLRQYKDEARSQLLNFIEGMLWAEDGMIDRRIYIGVKGKVGFGAVRLPGDVTRVGAVVSESLLYDFYGPPQATAPSSTAPSATSPAD